MLLYDMCCLLQCTYDIERALPCLKSCEDLRCILMPNHAWHNATFASSHTILWAQVTLRGIACMARSNRSESICRCRELQL